MKIIPPSIARDITKSLSLFFLLFLVFIYSFVAFLPKENIYFYTLTKLNNSHISLTNEKTISGFFDFTILDGDVAYRDTNALHMEKLTINYLIFTGNAGIENILFDGLKIDNLEVKWNILNPNTFNISIDSLDLKAYGTYNKNTKKLELFTTPSVLFLNKYQMIFSQSEQLKNGEYKIEYNL